ncbi:protein-tyrosine phosphatase-like protein [Armillaria borealis]|uniref:protein-tyrosine-phosphatase n=1 Tax=Armillaria borealis TaxID=47425 RepID=A0AA39N3C9_9AGAR|nr:protein-tyrosine phosphatase-like protein [Armillaria borealis]
MDVTNAETELVESLTGMSDGDVDANECEGTDPENPEPKPMEEIIEGQIFLRTLNEAMSEDLRQKHNITHVLTLCNTYLQPEQRHDLVLVVRQDADEDFYSHFYKAVDYIHSALMRQGKVLIHCTLDTSRGTVIVAAYLVHTRNTTVDEAIAYIRQRGEWTVPHDSFMRQLRIYECSHNPSPDNPNYVTWKSKTEKSAETYLFLDRIYLRGSFLPDEDEVEAKIKEMKVTHLLTTVSQRGLSMDSKFHVIDTQRIYKAAQFIHSALEAKGTVLIYYPGESVGWSIICAYLMAYTNSDNSEMVYATMDAGLVSNVFEGEWKPVSRPPRIVVTGTEYPDATESEATGAKGREVAKVANNQALTVSANESLNHQEVEEDQNVSKTGKTKFSKKVKTWFSHGRSSSKSGKEG